MAHAMTAHWRETAEYLARTKREQREAYRQQQANAALYQALAAQQAMQAQHYVSMVPSDLGQGRLGQQSSYQGFCNCVPSRGQVWASPHGLVQDLNTLEPGAVLR